MVAGKKGIEVLAKSGDRFLQGGVHRVSLLRGHRRATASERLHGGELLLAALRDELLVATEIRLQVVSQRARGRGRELRLQFPPLLIEARDALIQFLRESSALLIAMRGEPAVLVVVLVTGVFG